MPNLAPKPGIINPNPKWPFLLRDKYKVAPGKDHLVDYTVRESVTLASGENQIHSTLMLNGELFGGTISSPFKLLKWTDPKNLAVYTSITGSIADSAENNADDLCYASSTGLLYTAHGGYLHGDSSFHIRVSSFKPSDLTKTTFADISVSASFTPSSQIPICTDNLFIYFLTGSTSEDAQLFKINLEDGKLVTSIVITGRRGGHTILYEPSNSRIYMGGANTGTPRVSWAAYAPTDLSTHSSTTVVSQNTTLITDDSAFLNNEFWVGTEGTGATGNAYRVAADLSSVTAFNVGSSVQIFGVIPSEGYLYMPLKKSPGEILRVDPTGPTVVETITLESGENDSNEVVVLPSGERVVTCFLSPAKIIRLPDSYTTSSDTQSIEQGKLVEDTLSLADEATTEHIPGGGGIDYEQPVDDTLGLSDALVFDRMILLEETIGLADAVVFAREILLEDSLSLSDNVATEKGIFTTVDDSVSLSDSVIFNREIVITDSAGLADALTFERGMLLEDSLSTSDALVFDRAIVLTDSLGLADAIVKEQGLLITDTVSLDDLADVDLTTSSEKTVNIDDSVLIQDSNARQLNGLFVSDTTGRGRKAVIIGRF